VLYRRLAVREGVTDSRNTGPATESVSVGLVVPIPTLLFEESM